MKYPHLLDLRTSLRLLAGLGVIGLSFTQAAAAPGDADPGFTANADNGIYIVSPHTNGSYVVGGDFTTVNGESRNRFARLDSNSVLDSLEINFDMMVRCFACQTDDKLLIGGWFNTVNGQARARLIRVNADGSLDGTFNPGFNHNVSCIQVLPDGNILVGGAFTNVGGVGIERIVRLKPDGSIDSTFNASAGGTIYGMAAQEDGNILIWGSFTTLNNTVRSGIGRVRPDGELDPDFAPPTDGIVYAVSEDLQGRLIVSGSFTTIAGGSRIRLARLHADGTLDENFDPAPNATVSNIQVQADGKIIMGGLFTTIDGSPVNRLCRLDEDGHLDPTFNGNANGPIYTTLLQPDGSILIGGNFSAAGGASRGRMARITNGPAGQSLTVPEADTLQWHNEGTAPILASVQFRLSTDDGQTWTHLGYGSRMNGGWELSGLSLPQSGLIEATGTVFGGRYNGTSYLVTKQKNFQFTDLEMWRFAHFGTVANSGNAADDADPDGDGIANLVEYGFDHDPLQPSAHLMPAWNYQGSFATLNFPRPAAKAGLSLVVEKSSNLHPDEWSPVADTGTPNLSLYLVPLSGEEKLFMRLGVRRE